MALGCFRPEKCAMSLLVLKGLIACLALTGLPHMGGWGGHVYNMRGLVVSRVRMRCWLSILPISGASLVPLASLLSTHLNEKVSGNRAS